jgi:prophage DNA circulation protein
MMLKPDAIEAKPIVEVTLNELLAWSPTSGRPGSDLRTAVGTTLANLPQLLQYDMLDGPLITCFDLAYTNGIQLYQIEIVRRTAAAQTATLVGSTMTKNTLIELALATAGYIISGMTFVSRDDVDRIKLAINAAFEDMEEEIADEMDAMTWRAILKLHAAMSMHLVETARPLPRMLNYHFNLALPSVVLAHRLYADAGRADELRNENKIVHPAFCPLDGRALSA